MPRKGKKKIKFSAKALVMIALVVGAMGGAVHSIREPLTIARIIEGNNDNSQQSREARESASDERREAANERAAANREQRLSSGDTKNQPEGTYPVYENGASSGKIVGYRYIQAPGVFEGAIQRANKGIQADLDLLKSKTYGMTQKDIKYADKMIKDGYTWVPGGVGCNDMPARKKKSAGSGVDDQGNPTQDMYCDDWHWTQCLNPGSGVNGVGCDQPEDNNPPGSPAPEAFCRDMRVFDKAWNELKPTDFKQGDNGKEIYLCVAGGGKPAQYTKGRFQVNGKWRAVVTFKKPNSNYFCDLYKIPSNKFDFDISAKVYHKTLGWQ